MVDNFCLEAYRKMAVWPAHFQAMSLYTSPKKLSTTACIRASLALMLAAPRLLGHGPSILPVLEARVAIVRFRRRHAPAAPRTTLVVMRTAPGLLRDRPEMKTKNCQILSIIHTETHTSRQSVGPRVTRLQKTRNRFTCDKHAHLRCQEGQGSFSGIRRPKVFRRRQETPIL